MCRACGLAMGLGEVDEVWEEQGHGGFRVGRYRTNHERFLC